MKKSSLLSYLMWGYMANMDVKEYEDLKKKLVLFEKESKIEDSSKLAEKLLVEFPEFQIMHQSFMRARMDKISNNVNTIKIIAVIYFIASVVSALYLFSKFSS